MAVGRAKGWKGLEEDSAEQTKDTLSSYPMDFYSVSRGTWLCGRVRNRYDPVVDATTDDSLGPWTPRHGMGRPLRPVRAAA